MTTSPPSELVSGARRMPWAWLVFIASALAIPACYFVGASISGENHFGQGLEGSFYWSVFWMVQVLSFLGFMLSPFLSPRSVGRQAAFMMLGVLTFLVVEFLCSLFIAFGMFPD